MKKSYAEIVLDCLFEKCKTDNSISLNQVFEYVQKIDKKITLHKVRYATTNFKKIGLFTTSKPAVYELDRSKIETFYKDFKNGAAFLWGRKDEIGNKKIRYKNQLSDVRVTSKMFTARAIIAMQNSPFTSFDIGEIAEKLKLDTNRKAIKNLTEKYKDCFKEIGKVGQFSKYVPTARFFERFSNEKPYYINLFPEKMEVIKKAFAVKKIDLKKKKNCPDIQTAESEPAAEPTPPETKCDQAPQVLKPFRPQFVIKAIFAAYNKPLAAPDIEAIAERYGRKIGRGTVLWYVSGKSKQIVKNGQRGRAPLYSPNEKFFKDNAQLMEKFIEILPDKKDAIITRFNLFGETTGRAALDLENGAPADQAPAGKVQAGAQDEIETGPQDEIAAQDIQDDLEVIGAANVGASILAYISKLQKRAKQQPDLEPSEAEQIKSKYQDAQQTIIYLRDQIQSLENSVKNLKQMVETGNKTIIELNHENSVLKNAFEDVKQKGMKSTFRVSEVARITSIVKRGQGAGNQHKR